MCFSPSFQRREISDYDTLHKDRLFEFFWYEHGPVLDFLGEHRNLGPVRLRWAHFVFTYKRPFLFHSKMGEWNGCSATVKNINLPFQNSPSTRLLWSNVNGPSLATVSTGPSISYWNGPKWAQRNRTGPYFFLASLCYLPIYPNPMTRETQTCNSHHTKP